MAQDRMRCRLHELVIHLKDSAQNWIKTCTTREELFDVVVLEQLLNTLGPAAHVCIKEWDLDVSAAAGRLPDDYEQVKNQVNHGTKMAEWSTRTQIVVCLRKTGHSGLLAQEKRKTEYLTPAVEETELPKAEKWTNKHELKRLNCGEKGHILRGAQATLLSLSNRMTFSGQHGL